jgi:hypothetical protein
LETNRERGKTMTTMTHPHDNGRKRSSLNDQINRLDSMLDGLSEGLNEAVADAVKKAVASAAQEALQGALTDVLTSPAMLAKLQTVIAPQVMARMPAPTAAPRIFTGEKLRTLWAGIRACVNRLRQACANRVRSMQTAAADLWRGAVNKAVGLWASCQIIRRFKYQLLTALSVGATVGVVVWYAGPWLAAVASGIGGFATSLAVQVGLWLRDVLGGTSDENACA